MRLDVLGSALVVAVLAASGTLGGAAPAAADTGPATLAATTDTVVATHFYDVRRRTYTLAEQAPWVTALSGSQVLTFGADTGFTGSPLLGGTSTVYPVSRFDATAGTIQSLGTVDLLPLVGPDSWVRVLDYQYLPQLVSADPEHARTLLSIATYSAQTGCRTLIVNEVNVDLTGGGRNSLGQRWFTLPCVRPYTPTEGTWLVGPGLHQSGGRVALVPAMDWAVKGRPEIYLTVGDFAVLGNLGAQVSPDARRLLATVVRVPERGRVTIVARGVRNAQGLTVATLDRAAALVATTHGPRGGDGLLDVHLGDDYGWPRESYGTVYDYTPTPVQSKPLIEGRLPTVTKPVFGWLPSIAPSAVAQVARGGVFATWWGSVRGRSTGDLLVSGMVSQELYRIRWDDGAVRYVEAMDVGARIRSLAQTSTGVIVAGIDTAGPDAGTIMVLDPVKAWDSATSSFR